MSEVAPDEVPAEPKRKYPKLRAFTVNGALVLGALVAVFGTAEAYLRFTGFHAADFSPNAVLFAQWTEPDQLLGFVRIPGTKWRRKAYPDRFAPVVSYETDANGFRNPPGINAADIAFIGDSFTEGATAPFENTFPRLVEAKLGTRVINLGRYSYGPPQELAVLWKYGLSYQPKTVVWVLFEGNDLADSQLAYNGLSRQLYLPLTTNWSKMGSMWFNDVQLHELAQPPNGDDWYYRAAPLMNLTGRFAESHVVGENLIQNGRFKYRPHGNPWEIPPSLRDAVEQVPAPRAPVVKRALRAQVPAGTDVEITQTVQDLKPATPYLLTGYFRTENLLGPARLEVQQWHNGECTLLRFAPGVSRTHDWTKVSVVFTTSATPGDVRILLRRPANPPKAKQGTPRPKLLQLVDVALHQRARLRDSWGLVGTFDSAEYGVTEVGFRYKCPEKIDETFPQGWMVTSEMLARGHDLCRENGIRLLIVYLPTALRVHGPYCDFAADAPLNEYLPGGDWNIPDEFALRAAAFCAERQIPFIDATAALRDAAGRGEMVYAPRYDTHLFYRGHEIVAELLATAIETHK
ncbi:MAG: SGNH/GDSL hydrolase family protein [Candidatus Hydrogenedentes bacterium]|nr:SGNH/GDSL hydrolase family protein [Candidatus Hydrogenedentota bacterium]